MCCFSQPVDYVRATQIFARPSRAGQFVVYTMNFKAASDLAMILPIPTPRDAKEDAVTFINLEKYPELFDDLRTGFPEPRSLGRAKGDAPKPLPEAAPKLKVVEVGSFVASFVPTVKDFSRLDEQFRLPDGTWDKLPAYKDYGFAVFKLKKGEQKVHPMAFDFPRADPKQLFFPTVHIHDGKVHDRANFDHVLYCQGADTGMRWNESPQPASFFVKKIDETKGIVDGKAHVYRNIMVGTRKNEDTWV
jgi:hypothetical protein